MLPPNALCDRDDVKRLRTAQPHLSGPMSGQYDELIERLIGGFSSFAERYCEREFAYRERIEEYNGGRRAIRIQAPPIDLERDIEVWDDPTRVFDETRLLKLNEDYWVYPTKPGAGSLIVRPSGFRAGIRSVRIRYTGGVAALHDGVMLNEELRMAAAMQVAYWFEQRSRLGLTQMNEPGGAAMFVRDPSNLLPAVKLVLDRNRHFS